MAFEELNAGSFALTFLDYERFKEMMRNDELAIEKVAGNIFYKNKDGHYFSMDISNRREQFINSIRRDFRERGNLSSYDVYAFDIPALKLQTNVLEINGVNEELTITDLDLKDLTVTLYFDIIKPLDLATGIITSSYTGDTNFLVAINSNDSNQNTIQIKSNQAILLSDVLTVAEDDSTLTFGAITATGEIEEAYVLGVYIVLSHDYNQGDTSKIPWTFDGSWRWDGSKSFY